MIVWKAARSRIERGEAVEVRARLRATRGVENFMLMVGWWWWLVVDCDS